MSIKSIAISKELINDLSLVFDNKIVKNCFKENMWIAGGFARKIGHLILGLSKPANVPRYIRSYLDPSFYPENQRNLRLNRPGDIDFFSSDQSSIHNITDIYKSESDDQLISGLSSNVNYGLNSSTFANNIHYYHNYHNKYSNNYSCHIKIQLVRKFCFESIKSCFDSFDITNSKYAISKPKSGNHYVLHYDDEALRHDTMNMLHINHSNTPYLASRIVKYLKNRNISSISTDDITKNNFNEYLYKCVQNKWDSLYNINSSFIEDSIKSINNVRKLSDFELSMFIGKISHNIATTVKSSRFGSYGVYMTTTYTETDWASNMLSERA
tara:strand:- start:365 stop:1342 length:978 start_codon:yes stop_codon:yes gene_type:complete